MLRRVALPCLLAPVIGACSPTDPPGIAATSIPMDASHWHAGAGRSDLAFVSREGFPDGLMEVRQGTAALDQVRFSDGTIDFDVLLTGGGMPGIRFRQRDEGTAEEVYIRPEPDCPASDDCMQYAPVIRGAMLWDEFPEYQHAAPINPTGWNHVRLVVSGRRLAVFVNRQVAPSLTVGRLQGEARSGGLEVKGPAVFANMTTQPGVVDGLPSAPLPDPTREDPNRVRDWQVSGWSILPAAAVPDIAQSPPPGRAWRPLATDDGGVADLNRLYRTPDPGTLRCVAWLKTTVRADRDTSRRVSIGWLRETWIFVNGVPVFTGRNFWDPPGPKRRPDGRLSLQNATVDLPLRHGTNVIAVALSNEDSDSTTHFGWGFALRFDNATGLDLP